jgi:hypothetical protein
MKKICYITIVLFTVFGCKKNSSTTTKSSTPTTVSSFSVDGISVNKPTHSSFMNGGNYGVIAYGANSNPEIQITFYGSTAPSYGTYAITTGTVTYGRCLFTLSDTGYTSSATSGFINVVTSGTAPNNIASFSNISVSGHAGHHIVSGTVTY